MSEIKNSNRYREREGFGHDSGVSSLALEVDHAIGQLAHIARTGSVERVSYAAAALLERLSVFLEIFESLCEERPELFRPFARERENWPTLFHLHPELAKRTAQRMETLQLAKNCGLNYTGKTWSFETPANQVVLELYEFIGSCRSGEHTAVSVKVDGVWLPDPSEAQIREWMKRVGYLLPPLSRHTYIEWSNKTQELIRIRFGNEFQDHPSISKIAGGAISETDKYGRTARGRRRSAILRALRDAWEGMSALREPCQ